MISSLTLPENSRTEMTTSVREMASSLAQCRHEYSLRVENNLETRGNLLGLQASDEEHALHDQGSLVQGHSLPGHHRRVGLGDMSV